MLYGYGNNIIFPVIFGCIFENFVNLAPLAIINQKVFFSFKETKSVKCQHF